MSTIFSLTLHRFKIVTMIINNTYILLSGIIIRLAGVSGSEICA